LLLVEILAHINPTVEEVKNETDRLQKESEPLFKKYAQTAQQP
jgi:hypothetical protein